MNEPLHFVALSESDFDMWTDGINALLNKPVSDNFSITKTFPRKESFSMIDFKSKKHI